MTPNHLPPVTFTTKVTASSRTLLWTQLHNTELELKFDIGFNNCARKQIALKLKFTERCALVMAFGFMHCICSLTAPLVSSLLRPFLTFAYVANFSSQPQ